MTPYSEYPDDDLAIENSGEIIKTRPMTTVREITLT